MSGWNKARWTWKRLVRGSNLSDAAKVLSAALCDEFANHETGLCVLATDTMAEAIGKSRRAVQRALAELEGAGWLALCRHNGSGRATQITCSVPENVDRRVNVVPLRGDSQRSPDAEREPESSDRTGAGRAQSSDTYDATSARSVATPCTPYKDKPNQNHRAGKRPPGRPTPHLAACIHHGSHRETAWNNWLTRHRYPPLRELDRPSSDAKGIGYDMPFAMPPDDGDGIERGITERFLDWAMFRMHERTAAVEPAMKREMQR